MGKALLPDSHLLIPTDIEASDGGELALHLIATHTS
jgi:hypothetical protein